MFQVGVLSLANQGFGFSKFSGSIKFGIFSGGSFQNFIRFKISSWFWFKKFRVKSAQVAKIGFKVFSQSLGKQVVSFCKVRFCGLRFFWQSQVSKISYIFFSKSFGRFGSGFFAKFFFWRSRLFVKSIFRHRFRQILGSGVFVSQSYFPKQSRACKNLWHV